MRNIDVWGKMTRQERVAYAENQATQFGGNARSDRHVKAWLAEVRDNPHNMNMDRFEAAVAQGLEIRAEIADQI